MKYLFAEVYIFSFMQGYAAVPSGKVECYVQKCEHSYYAEIAFKNVLTQQQSLLSAKCIPRLVKNFGSIIICFLY